RSTTAEEATVYLEELLGRYRKKVIYWCLCMTGQREEAADLAQDIFLKVLNHLGTFRGESRFSTWLYQIARNHCNDFLKRRRLQLFEPLADAVIDRPADARLPIEQKLDRQEILKVFMDTVSTSLTDVEKKVAYMHFADGVTLPEITRLL